MFFVGRCRGPGKFRIGENVLKHARGFRRIKILVPALFYRQLAEVVMFVCLKAMTL